MIHVKYGGFFQKLTSNLWKTPLVFQEWNSTEEVEVLVANTANSPQLRMRCRYLTGIFRGKKKARWNFYSTDYGRPVLAAYGKTADQAQVARLEWPRKFGHYDFPSEPSSKPWGSPGFGGFVPSPYCNVDCSVKVDDELILLMYNGRYIPLNSPCENNYLSTGKNMSLRGYGMNITS